jgi:hypothetical protein
VSLLTIIQDAAKEMKLGVPASVIGNPDVEVVDMLRFAQRLGRELPLRGEWQTLRTPSTFTSLAQEEQTGMVPTDLARFINETFWNRSRKRPLQGPMDAQQWQTIKSWTTSPTQDTFTVYGSNIHINPVPPAGETFAFEYITNQFCRSAGGVAQASWLADTDTARIPEELFTLGIVSLYLRSEWQPGAVDAEARFEKQVRQYLTSDGPKRTVSMAGGSEYGRYPGIVVPEGYWMVP